MRAAWVARERAVLPRGDACARRRLQADPGQTGLEVLLRKTYMLYTDFVLKNPFYTLDMPIRVELFDTALRELIEGSVRSEQRASPSASGNQ